MVLLVAGDYVAVAECLVTDTTSQDLALSPDHFPPPARRPKLPGFIMRNPKPTTLDLEYSVLNIIP